MITQRFLVGLSMAQATLGTRVLARFLRTAHGRRLPTSTAAPAAGQRVAVIVPVLNEVERLGPCLEGLLAQGPEVASILVVDGGSTDGTQALVREAMARDTRLRLIDAAPVPPDWNGKAWGLNVGVDRADPALPWILTMDADVRVAPPLVRSLLAHAAQQGVAALSLATRQQISTLGEGLLHPSMLTTLVYRFGLPGHASRARGRIQANGQCFLVRRAALAQTGALSAARASRCEDVTIARCLAAHGVTVGFYESDDPAWVRMYGGWRETWQNWPRSLPLRDQYWHVGSILGLAEVTLVQALPMPLLTLLLALDARGRMASRAHTGQRATLSGRQQAETGDRRASTAWRQSQGVAPAPSLSGNGLHADSSRRRYRLLFVVNLVLLMARLGVLQGTARAYRARPWSYWLSPLCDLPVSVQLWRSLLRRRHTWRGRVLVPGVLV